MTACVVAVLCAVLATCIDPAEAATKEKPKKADPAKEKVPAPVPDQQGLSDTPPAENLRDRVEWARFEADRLRAIISGRPRDERASTLLASLAVVVTTDLERSLATGDVDNAAALRKVVERKLPDTRWRLGLIGGHGAGGGHFALGVMALHGILGERDRDAACVLFQSAWDKGFLDSAYRLSDCVAASAPAREPPLLEAAADFGHAAASEQLGRRCLESTPQDTKCAFSRLSAAAAAGRPSAKSVLGWMYAQGVGVAIDPQRAQSLYLEAAGAGDRSAKNNLGELYETGRGVAADPAKAAAYYREAAEGGFAPAQFNLGRMYAAGTGLPQDAGKAREWLRAALKGGIQPAQKVLDWLDARAVR